MKNTPSDQVKAALKAGGLADNIIPIPFTVTVVKMKGKYVMFDSGTGGQVKPTAGLLAAKNMKAAGIDPTKIETIIVTHFHSDHIFGLMAKDTRLIRTQRSMCRNWNLRGGPVRRSRSRRRV